MNNDKFVRRHIEAILEMAEVGPHVIIETPTARELMRASLAELDRVTAQRDALAAACKANQSVMAQARGYLMATGHHTLADKLMCQLDNNRAALSVLETDAPAAGAEEAQSCP